MILTSLSPSTPAQVEVDSALISAGTYGVFSNPVYEKTIELPKKAWIGTKNIFYKKKINKKLLVSLEKSSESITSKDLEKIESTEDQLDLLCFYIKYDIAKDLTSEINLPTWGQELESGINNVSLRINILLEQYQTLISQITCRFARHEKINDLLTLNIDNCLQIK